MLLFFLHLNSMTCELMKSLSDTREFNESTSRDKTNQPS